MSKTKAKKPRNADHVRRKNAPTPSDEVIEARLASLLTPAILGHPRPTRLCPAAGASRADLEFSGDGGGAFLIVKRVLNLAYLWTGSENGELLHVWSTWLFFAVLVDLGDAVAEARQKGLADDPVKYFAAPENQDLGVVKRIRKKRPPAADPPPLKEDLTTLGFA